MGKNPDPGSGINIPDPQHCSEGNIFSDKHSIFSSTLSNFHFFFAPVPQYPTFPNIFMSNLAHFGHMAPSM
jgi:hypothetical protein